MKNIILLTLIAIVSTQIVLGQDYKLEDSEIFKPQKEKKVLLFSKNSQSEKIVLFYSKLAVNTDGTPKSYHPDDPTGDNIALNSICNAIAVRKTDGKKERLKCADARGVFRRFQANNWTVPKGFTITWKNVIAARDGKPCIFQAGESKGYFGSLTSVKNGLGVNKRGECEYKNQLDALEIPNLVLPAEIWTDKNKVSHRNPLWEFEVKKEDLVFAYNPENGIWCYAIIGDGGPPENLGEGSVALNMKLLDKTEFPKNYIEAKKNTDTGSKNMLIAIIPNSNIYEPDKPYTKENIEKRGRELIKKMGYADEKSFIGFLKEQQSKF